MNGDTIEVFKIVPNFYTVATRPLTPHLEVPHPITDTKLTLIPTLTSLALLNPTNPNCNTKTTKQTSFQ